MNNLMNFALAFLLLGTFWISHYCKYHVIRRIDDSMIWLNILTLMFVVLIPFSTSAYDDYTDLWPAVLFFEGNILVVGLPQYAQWEYAIRGLRLVDDDYEERNISLLHYLNLVTPAFALLARHNAVTYSAGTFLDMATMALRRISRSGSLASLLSSGMAGSIRSGWVIPIIPSAITAFFTATWLELCKYPTSRGICSRTISG